MNLDQLKQAGFSDQEISGYVSEKSSNLKDAGFGQGEIDSYFEKSRQTILSSLEEKKFQSWYANVAQKTGLNPNPDDPQHYYDYRAAWKGGISGPDISGHWPSEYKLEGHPRMFIEGINTKTGERVPELAVPYIPKGLPNPLMFQGEPIPFDLDSVINKMDETRSSQEPSLKGGIGRAMWPVVRPFLAQGYKGVAAFNRGLATFSTHLDLIGDYINEKTGGKLTKEGAFEEAAKTYEANATWWKERADKIGVNFIDELIGEAAGGAVPGIAEFILNVPYAAALGAAKARKEGKSEIAGALVEGAKRGILGQMFRAMEPLKQYLRAPLMGTVFGAQAASEGGTPKEVAKAAATGALYSLTSPGGQMGLNELRANLKREAVRIEAEKPRIEPAIGEIKPSEEVTGKKEPEVETPLAAGPSKPESPSGAITGTPPPLPGELTVYRAGREIGHPDTGTWYSQERPEGLAEAKEYKIIPKNPLVVPKAEITNESIPSMSLLEKWFPEYDKPAEPGLLPQKQVMTPEKIDKIVKAEAEKRGYDAIIYGEGKEGQIQYFGKKETAGKGGEVMAFAPKEGFRKEPEVGPVEGEITRRSDLVRFLTENLDIPIRTGRFRDKALGIFKLQEGVIRTKLAKDIEVIAHEVGHALHQFLFPESVSEKGLSASPFSTFKDELNPLASEPKAGQDVTPEGFAEFTRLYVTDPKKAKASAPRFYDYFEHLLDEKSPEAKDILLTTRERYQKYLDQGWFKRILGNISMNPRPGKGYGLDELYRDFWERIYPLRKVTQEMIKGTGFEPYRTWYGSKVEPLPVAEDPYKLARIYPRWPSKVEQFIYRSPFEFETYKSVGEPLDEIWKPIRGKENEYVVYSVAKRAIEKHKQKIETGLLDADVREAVKNGEAEFGETFRKNVDYRDNVLKYFKDSGMIDEEIYGKFKEMNKDYVPFFRIFEEQKETGVGKALEAFQPIKKMTGSWADIQNPMESDLKNTILLMNMAERNAIGQAFVNLSKVKTGLGKFIEKLPIPIKPTKVGIEEIFNKPELEAMAEAGIVPDESFTIFRPNSFNPEKNVISVWFDGKKENYKIPQELADIWSGFDKEGITAVVKLLSYPAKWLRAGATLTPEFAGRNVLRDMVIDFVQTPLSFPGVDFAKGIGHWAKKDEVFQDWYKGGGPHSAMVSMDRDYLKDNIGKILQDSPIAGHLKHPLELMQIISEVSEAATRLGVFEREAGKEGRTKEDILRGAYASAEATVDFRRFGAITKSWSAITAFWNPNMQGLDRMVREFRDNPLPATAKVLLSITLPSLLLEWANHDDPRYKEIPAWQKDLFFVFIPNRMSQEQWDSMTSAEKAAEIQWVTGSIWRLPKPFELGVLFGALPQRFLRYMLDKDPHAFDGLASSLTQVATPGIIPTAGIPFVENYANKSIFTGRNIVPLGREDLMPEYQYGPYTSETAKAIGGVLGKLPWIGKDVAYSPAKIDNLVYAWTGGMGRYAMQLADLGLKMAGVTEPIGGEKAVSTLDDLPFIKGFHVRFPGSQAESIQRFYDNYKESNAKWKTVKFLIEKEGRIEKGFEILQDSTMLKLDGIKQALTNQHNFIDMVNINPQITGQEKREFIDMTYMEMIEIAKMGNQIVDEMETYSKKSKEAETRIPKRMILETPERKKSIPKTQPPPFM